MTPRLAAGDTLVIATHNPGKRREIAELLQPYGLRTVSAGSLGLPEPEETESTFAGNARLKADAAARASGLPALADDSGLEVDLLSGEPGVLSARWAGPDKDFVAAMQTVADRIAALRGWTLPEPRATFTCALCLAWPEGTVAAYEGRVYGTLVWPSRGERGFGYDPMFLPDGSELTFGEMDPHAKHAISHRARAFASFVAASLDAPQS